MNVFGMVTTSASAMYTNLALDSFFQRTAVGADDVFLLIDNDNCYSPPVDHPSLTLISNPTQRSFAANANHILAVAEERCADAVLLNNDIVFTPDWLPPLCSLGDAITLPFSNQIKQYDLGALSLRPEMDLDDYQGRESELLAVVAQHQRQTVSDHFVSIFAPFFACRIPYALHSRVGRFDERFTPAGGEDIDYRIRAHLAGFHVAYACRSYVLHFSGKSTWRTAEQQARRAEHQIRYTMQLYAKWGRDVVDLLRGGDDAREVAVRLSEGKSLLPADLLRIVAEHVMPA